MTTKTENLSNSPAKKTVQQADTRDTLPEKQMQIRKQPAYPNVALEKRQAEEAQQQ